MGSFFSMLSLQAVLLLYILVGRYVSKKGIVPVNGQIYFIDFLLSITMPCMIFNSFTIDISLDQLASVSVILVASFLVCLFSSILGMLIYNKIPYEKKAVMQYGTLVSNSAFAGLPQVDAAYGQIGLFYGSIYLIPLRIFVWSVGISIFTKCDLKTKIRNVALNPNLIAVYLGLICMIFSLKLPSPFLIAVKSIGSCTTPLSMIIIGMVLADVNLRTVFEINVIYLTFIRLIVIPITVLAVMKFLHVDSIIIGISVLLSAMPIGATTPALAQKHGADSVFASKCMFVSTVSSLITIPLISLLINL